MQYDLLRKKRESTRNGLSHAADNRGTSGKIPFSPAIPNSVMIELFNSQQHNSPNADAPNKTGLPDALKERFERRFGLSLDDVRVHRNSDKPAELDSAAYARGNEIHLGPGQEQHLEHELRHVVQQKAGLVRATGSVHGEPVNDDTGLEQAADDILTQFSQKEMSKIHSVSNNDNLNQKWKKNILEPNKSSGKDVIQRQLWNFANSTGNWAIYISDDFPGYHISANPKDLFDAHATHVNKDRKQSHLFKDGSIKGNPSESIRKTLKVALNSWFEELIHLKKPLLGGLRIVYNDYDGYDSY